MANRARLKIWMLVVDRLTHVSLFNDHAAIRRFISRAAFSELRVSLVPFAMFNFP